MCVAETETMCGTKKYTYQPCGLNYFIYEVLDFCTARIPGAKELSSLGQLFFFFNVL